MNNTLQSILDVFFGTVRRAQWTIGLSALVYFSWRPQDLLAIFRSILHGILLPILGELVAGVAQTVGGLMGSVITILLVYLGFRAILKGMFGKAPPAKRKKG